MILEFPSPNVLWVLKEVSDPTFGNDDSWFLHRVKKALQAKGYDCVKKRAWKDGHLVSDDTQYVRDRRGRWYIYDNDWAIRSIAKKFDTEGIVSLRIEGEVTK